MTSKLTKIAREAVESLKAPHPNDRVAQTRLFRKALQRARNHVPSTAVLDAMTRAALEVARDRIEELERTANNHQE